jgi:hypothetical protein
MFDKEYRETYQSKEEWEKKYADKGKLAMGEMRELIPEVENISEHKSSLFIVRDIEKMKFNIEIADEDKVYEIKLKYDNIGSPNKVKFHRNTSDMFYSD